MAQAPISRIFIRDVLSARNLKTGNTGRPSFAREVSVRGR